MSERISKIFDQSESDSESEYSDEFSDVYEEYIHDIDDENEDNEDEEDEDDVKFPKEYEVKDKKAVKKVENISTKHRDNSTNLIKKMFEKYNIASKNRDVKIKELETAIYSKSNNNFSSYNDMLRSVSTSCNNLNYIQLKNMVMGNYFDNALFSVCKAQDEKALNNITCRLEPMSGIHKCKCGCDKVYSYELQTRSADEGMTLFLQCYECGKKWRN